MAQPEVPTFIHSEAERAEMLTRMQVIAGRHEISADELEEVGWLILERDTDYDLEGDFDGGVLLPNRDRPEIVLLGATKGEYFQIVMCDGIDINRYTGEFVQLSKDKDRGSLRWHVGIFGSMYSEILGRRIEVESRDDVMAVDPLSPREHASFAKRLVGSYVRGVLNEF